ncbi:protein kinase [Angomonas deanei]|uniref:PB1 domain containing protein n=1 Tax=Angomonas deanei TaxID=59799 RepID=A0A7G2CPL0_9TRYP|nr:protein kinase [Angomonas deanei]CAD2221720.1 hypothetical protein, conserved [Angomonas deanei]|eukprot:EPY21797.1 protein kinase [Angomonas deanei]
MPPTTKPKAAGAPPPAKAKNKAAGAGKLPAVKPSPTVSKTPRPETSEKKKKQSIGALGIDKSKPLEKINTKPSPKGTTVTAAAGRKKKEEEEEEKETSSPSIKETSVSAGPPKAPSPTVKKPSPPPVKPLRTRPNALSHSSERESKETKKKEETEEEDDEDDEDEDENEEEEDSDEEDSDEEDDDDEDEEDSDDDDDDDDESEEESSSRRKTKKKKDDGPRLTTKVSREGDKNVKQIYITKKTKFEKYVSEVMERFGFEEATDFDMYCVDAAGDHVDIDVSEDFQELLEPYWPRLAAATSDAGKPQTKKPAAKSANSDVLNGNHERSSDTVVRLYVRESFAYRQRTGQSTKAPSFVSNTHMAGSPPPTCCCSTTPLAIFLSSSPRPIAAATRRACTTRRWSLKKMWSCSGIK